MRAAEFAACYRFSFSFFSYSLQWKKHLKQFRFECFYWGKLNYTKILLNNFYNSLYLARRGIVRNTTAQLLFIEARI